MSSDLQRLLGVDGEPVSVKYVEFGVYCHLIVLVYKIGDYPYRSTIYVNCSHYYWRKAFPLYDSSYDSVMEAIDKMERDLPGFFYAGNFNKSFSLVVYM